MNATSTLLIALALLAGGCASIPPDALTHATALKEFQKKSTAATVGVFDSSTTTIKYTLENWRKSGADDAQEYVDACKEASGVFANTKSKLQDIAELTALLPSVEAGKQAELIAKIGTKIKAVQDEMDTRRMSFDSAVATVQKRSSDDATAFAAHVRDIELTASKLRAAVTESAGTVNDGIAAQEELLKSYLSAHSKMKQVFGASLSAQADNFAKEAGGISAKYAPLISTIESILKK